VAVFLSVADTVEEAVVVDFAVVVVAAAGAGAAGVGVGAAGAADIVDAVAAGVAVVLVVVEEVAVVVLIAAVVAEPVFPLGANTHRRWAQWNQNWAVSHLNFCTLCDSSDR